MSVDECHYLANVFYAESFFTDNSRKYILWGRAIWNVQANI